MYVSLCSCLFTCLRCQSVSVLIQRRICEIRFPGFLTGVLHCKFTLTRTESRSESATLLERIVQFFHSVAYYVCCRLLALERAWGATDPGINYYISTVRSESNPRTVICPRATMVICQNLFICWDLLFSLLISSCVV